MSKFFFAILFSFFAIKSFGQPKLEKEKEKINTFCDKFMLKFSSGKFSEAIQSLKQNSVISHSSIDTLGATVIEQMNKFQPAYGDIISYEFISERKIKNFIAKRFYILKFKKYFLKFDFTLYNNGSGWTITNFNYDDNLIEVLY